MDTRGEKEEKEVGSKENNNLSRSCTFLGMDLEQRRFWTSDRRKWAQAVYCARPVASNMVAASLAELVNNWNVAEETERETSLDFHLKTKAVEVFFSYSSQIHRVCRVTFHYNH